MRISAGEVFVESSSSKAHCGEVHGFSAFLRERVGRLDRSTSNLAQASYAGLDRRKTASPHRSFHLSSNR